MTDQHPQTSPLARSASPFLRHGAEQPVDWLPWGHEAFRRAREEDRPILLDIGAVWCHWCHVMDRESYEDPGTAALINELYVPVKVDRDESPAVDARYQAAVQALSGQGGWPLTAFLTPDGQVFHGGTYFPPEDAHGRPSFRRVLREISRVWRQDRGRVDQAAAAMREHLETALRAQAAPGELDPRLVDDAVRDLADGYDPRNGGFGRAPKFPNAGGIGLLLEQWALTGSAEAREMARSSLLAMARGGIHDHLGGGFHRYATDARWLIPHFEKMAYDNGPLLAAYAQAAALDDGAGSDELRQAARGIVAMYRDVAPDLLAAGGFPASQDADIGPEDDGDYWTWTEEEVRAALATARREDGGGHDSGADPDLLAEAALLHWGLLEPASGMHLDPDRHVLFRAMPPGDVGRALRDRLPAAAGGAGEAVEAVEAAALLETARSRLKGVRDGRPRPFVDETLYAGWVALVAAGHVAAARHLDMDDAGQAAQRAMERVWREAWTDGGVTHRLGDSTSGIHLADQAHCADAMLDLHEWTGETRWLDRARHTLQVVRHRFRDESGALLDLPRDRDGDVEVLAQPRFEIADAPEPSGNAIAARAFARLAAFDGDEAAMTTAREILQAFAGAAPRFAAAAATYFRALRWVANPVTTVVVVEEPDAGPGSLRRTALRTYRPNTVIRAFPPGAVATEHLPEAVTAMLTGAAPRAYVCVGHTCAAPVSEPAPLEELLRTF